MAILNTIQYMLTNKQSDQLTVMGFDWDSVISLKELDPDLFGSLSNSPADERILDMLAQRLTKLISIDGYEAIILPLGSPAFMFAFSRASANLHNCVFLFAHTERMSEDQIQTDGSTKKVAVFQHVKWLAL